MVKHTCHSFCKTISIIILITSICFSIKSTEMNNSNVTLCSNSRGVPKVSPGKWSGFTPLVDFPGSREGEEEREPGTHCSHTRQVSMVTCILLRYTKINFCLPAGRPHCRIILPARHLRAVLKSKTISLGRYRFVEDDLQRDEFASVTCHSIYLERTDSWIIPVSEELIAFIAPSSSFTQCGQSQASLRWHVSLGLV